MRSQGLTCALAVVALAAVGAACSPAKPAEQAAARPATFNRDIAPILFENCASCHRPIDGAAAAAVFGSDDDPICVAGAPFSVLDYESVRRNARAIASAVQRRAMPPWLPEPGHGSFADERRLTGKEIASITRWVESGAPQGDPADAPEPPSFSGGWQLGTPDLVLTLPEPYVLEPGSRDVFRNFVVPVPITRTRYVRAVEFRADLHDAPLCGFTMRAEFVQVGCRALDVRPP